MKQRPARPAPVSRRLRQEAGFGCVRCGCPIVRYHHIEGYDENDPYPVDKMIILCPNDHDMVTKGAVSKGRQYEWKAAPYNLRGQSPKVHGQLSIENIPFRVRMGGRKFTGDHARVVVDDEELLAMRHEDDQLLLSLNVTDDKGQRQAVIRDNEWVGALAKTWDIAADWRKLRIRSRERRIDFEIAGTHSHLHLNARLQSGSESVRITETRVVCRGGVGQAEFKRPVLHNGNLMVDTAARIVDLRAERFEFPSGSVTFDPDTTLGKLASFSWISDFLSDLRGEQNELDVLRDLQEVLADGIATIGSLLDATATGTVPIDDVPQHQAEFELDRLQAMEPQVNKRIAELERAAAP